MCTGTHSSSTVPSFVKSISRKRVWCVCVCVCLSFAYYYFIYFSDPSKVFSYLLSLLRLTVMCKYVLRIVLVCYFFRIIISMPKSFFFVSKSKRNVMGRKLTKDQFIFWFKNNWPDKRKMDLTSYWQWWVSDDFKLIEKKKGMECWK